MAAKKKKNEASNTKTDQAANVHDYETWKFRNRQRPEAEKAMRRSGELAKRENREA